MVFFDKYGTPSLHGVTDDGNYDYNGPAEAAKIGFKPVVMMMNILGEPLDDTTTWLTDQEEQWALIAASDYRNLHPSVQYTWPYMGANYTNVYGDFGQDAYWATARDLAKRLGGMGLDFPVGYFFSQSDAWRATTISQIKWANAHGIATLALLTPYSANPPAGVGPQFAHDGQFLDKTRQVIAYLQDNDALPSAWVVSNYSSKTTVDGKVVTANRIGAESNSTDPTIAHVALWVAQNAPVSPYVTLPSVCGG